MSDPLRTDGSRAFSTSAETDHETKIEELLLAGLDHYFTAEYDHAISVWTRVLFLDRSHARARAYIERARSALAERQRESEELLQNGVAAFERGDGGEARRLVRAAMEGGAPTDEALAVLDRLDRLGTPTAGERPSSSSRTRAGVTPASDASRAGWSALSIACLFAVALAASAGYSAAVWGPIDWRSMLAWETRPPRAAGSTSVRQPGLTLPRSGELMLTRARALVATGHLRDALTALDLVRPTDPQKAEADRLRGEIQLQLIALTSVPAQPRTEIADRPVP